MKKTYQLHLRIELEFIETLRKQAQDRNVTLAELCRLKIRQNLQSDKLDLLIKHFEEICKKRGLTCHT